jgi:carbamoyltransferase
VRSGFIELRYDEASICNRLGIPSIFEFEAKADGRRTAIEVHDGLDALIHLFLDSEALDGNLLRGSLPANLIAALEGLGLLARLETKPDCWYGTVWLYPVAGVYTVSDRPQRFEEVPMYMGTDRVFTAGSWSTRQFLDTLPHTPCGDLLDLCSGTGIAGLVCAPFAGRVWSCDLAERSVRFNEFNCRLNGMENVTCAQGDLYSPVAGLTFDRVVAHPPYVPGTQTYLYREGGEEGEEILSRVIADLPGYLRPGGRFYSFAMGTDRESGTMESRVRRWLGDREQEFDVIVMAYDVADKPSETVYRDVFTRIKATAVYFAAVVIARIESPRPPITARSKRAAKAGSEAVDWFLDCHIKASQAGFDEILWQARPRMTRHFSLLVKHTVTPAGKLAPSYFELDSAHPFKVELPCPAWVAALVSAYDGTRTAREVFDLVKQQRAVDPNFTEAVFLRDLRELLAHGLLEVDEFPLPEERAGR